MEGCKKVERLVIRDLELDENDAKYIGLIIRDYSSNLKHFEIAGIYFSSLTADFINGLFLNNSIQELVVNRIGLDENSFPQLVEAIVTNACLTSLDASNNPIKHGVNAFRDYKLNNLIKLHLNNCDIDDEHLMNLLQGLKNNQTIKILELNNNFITEASCINFVPFFDDNKSMEQIYILNNKICKRDLTNKLKDHDLTKIIAEI